MNKKIIFSLGLSVLLLLQACGRKKKPDELTTPARSVQVPIFNADSAYFFVERQIKFGPRVPNTKAHEQAADYFVNQFKKQGATVIVQDFDATTWDNQKVQLKNIIARRTHMVVIKISTSCENWLSCLLQRVNSTRQKSTPAGL